jgi:hypothetical protein
MTASHFFAWSAAMIPSKPVLVNFAVLPSCLAIALPMSMSEPDAFVPT